MSLEKAIVDLTDAINKIHLLFEAAKDTLANDRPSPVNPGPKVTAESSQPVTKITQEDLIEKLTHIQEKHGRDKALELLQKYNAKKISQIDSNDYESFIADAEILL